MVGNEGSIKRVVAPTNGRRVLGRRHSPSTSTPAWPVDLLATAYQHTRGGWVKLKKADLEELPVLDPRRLSPSQLQRLSDLFDALSEEEFERLPGMAHCPTRRRLDDGISEILGLPDLATLRDLLASEPVVSNTRL